MMKSGTVNLHCPPELVLHECSPKHIARNIKRWRGIAACEPCPRPAKHVPKGYGPEHSLYELTNRNRLKLDSINSPHGLLFRTEDNLSFLTKTLTRSSDLTLNGVTPTKRAARSLYYFSVLNEVNGREWTPTVPQMIYSVLNYGNNWSQHYRYSSTDSSFLELLGLGVEFPRILLLAIDYHNNKLFKGMDPDELVIRDPINVCRIFILNDSPILFHRLLDMELKFWSFPKSTGPRTVEHFENLNKSKGVFYA